MRPQVHIIAPIEHSVIFLSHNILKGEQKKERRECGRARTEKEKGKGVKTAFKSRKVRRYITYRK